MEIKCTLRISVSILHTLQRNNKNKNLLKKKFYQNYLFLNKTLKLSIRLQNLISSKLRHTSPGQTSRRQFGHRSPARVCPLLPQYPASLALLASGSVALLGPRNPGVEGCAPSRRARRHVCRFWPSGREGKSAGHDC